MENQCSVFLESKNKPYLLYVRTVADPTFLFRLLLSIVKFS